MNKNRFAAKIDPLVIAAITSFKRTFTKPQIIEKVLNDPAVANILLKAYRADPFWDINLIVKQGVALRVDRELRRRKKSKMLGVSMRIYENYALGAKGPRRWQRLDVMTISELQICFQWRKDNVRANAKVADTYKRLIDIMVEGQYETVGDALSA
jgi:hypothetical protein